MHHDDLSSLARNQRQPGPRPPNLSNNTGIAPSLYAKILIECFGAHAWSYASINCRRSDTNYSYTFISDVTTLVSKRL